MLHQEGVRVAWKILTGRRVLDLVSANAPVERLLFYMRCSDDSGLVHPCRAEDGIDACIWPAKPLSPRNLGVLAPIELLLRACETLAIDIVDVDVANRLSHLRQQGLTLRRRLAPTPVACNPDFILHAGVEKGCVEEIFGGKLVTLPATDSNLCARTAITNCNALQFGALPGPIALCPENRLSQSRHVDASIALPGHKERVCFPFRPSLKKHIHRLHIHLSR
mmetsp:Transcript_60861/g.132042  ORF Transcript_60861/g.132042 Transcript_60861/m.132042 type:complete len:222 (+) Transcript_60861:497-1162(+)